ncbi:hypothetical protein D3C76_165370 [compost metagenome]
MAKRREVLIKLASIIVWEFSHYTELGNGVYRYTLTDDATGETFKGLTRANSGVPQAIGNSPAKLSDVRLVGNVMTDANRFVLIKSGV